MHIPRESAPSLEDRSLAQLQQPRIEGGEVETIEFVNKSLIEELKIRSWGFWNSA